MAVINKKIFFIQKIFFTNIFFRKFHKKKIFLNKKKLIFTIKKFFQCDRRLLSAGTAKKQ